MAFQFPDVKADFTAPNGITYTWDAVDEKWRVKSFTTDSVAVTISDVAPADPNEGDLWFDSDEDSLTTFIWTGTEWIPAAPPVSLDSINAVINSALIVQEELLDRVGAGEVIQTTVVNEVQTLQNKVSALEGSIIDAVWTFEEDNRLPRAGEFALRAGTDVVTSVWSDARQIVISLSDVDGNDYTFEKISINDVIRLGAANGSGAEYRITGILAAGYYDVTHITSTGVSADEIPYAFTFLSAFDPAGLASIDYVDNQDDLKLNLTGGTMTGSLVLGNSRNLTFKKADDTHQLAINPNSGDYFTNIYAYNGGGIRIRAASAGEGSPYDTAISISSESQNIGGTDYNATLALNRVRTPNNNDQAANKWYVDNAISNADIDGYLPLTGGSLTGALEVNLPGNKAIKVFQNGTENAQIWADGTFQTTKTSFGPAHLVTKQYVDDAVSNINVSGDYLPVNGGVLTNTVHFKKGEKDYNQFTIAPNGGTDYATNIYSRNGAQMRLRTTPDKNGDTNYKTHIVLDGASKETKIFQLVDPTREDHAANKAYVDRWVAAPARLAWTFNGLQNTNSDPGTGKFYYQTGGGSGIEGYMRLSFESNNGCHLGDGKFNDTNVQLDYGPYGTIWQWRYDIEKWKLILQFRAQTWRWNQNNHFLFGIGSTKGRSFSDLAPGVDYYITVGGFF